MSTNPSDEQHGTGGTPPPPPPGTTPPGDPGAPPPGAYPPPGGYAPPQGGYAPPPGGYAPPPGAPQAPYAGGYATQPPLSDSDQRMWATIAHILPVVGLSFIVPLIIWLVFKGRGPFLEDQAKEALNFQITVAIVSIGISIIGTITFGIGFILYVGLIVALIWMILAAVATNKGELYRYPVNIRIIK